MNHLVKDLPYNPTLSAEENESIIKKFFNKRMNRSAAAKRMDRPEKRAKMEKGSEFINSLLARGQRVVCGMINSRA